jgi:hypothetical protein
MREKRIDNVYIILHPNPMNPVSIVMDKLDNINRTYRHTSR